MLLDRRVLRVGAVAGMLAALLGLVFNLIHPRSSSFTYQSEADLVHDSSIWLFDHYMLAIAILLGFVGYLAIAWSFDTEPSRSWGRLGSAVVIVSVSIAFLTLAHDGMAHKMILDEGIHREGYLAFFETNGALFNTVIGTLFGITPIVLGVAILTGDEYAGWVGWLGIIAGIVGFVDATIQWFGGFSSFSVNVLYLIASLIGTIFLFLASFQLMQRTASRSGAVAEAGTTP